MAFPESASSEPLEKAALPPRRSVESLPPVEAPTATFLLQLFLIPLLIVTIVVVLWLLFSWIAHMGRDNPQELVKALASGNDSSWQRAYELADLLRSPDPRYDSLRRDSKLARELAAFLDKDLNVAAKGEGEAVRVKRRMFLCRALGSFEIADGLPVLMRAAKEERDPVEVQVRLAALEAITTLAHNCGPASFQENSDLMQLLLEASREPDGGGPAPSTTRDGKPTTYRPHAEIRAVAAFALGVIGGDEALARLKIMLANAYPNARYNAATGLARHGDPACVSVLKEMLDPDNAQAASDENNDRDKDRKRATVLMNGVRATLIYAEANAQADKAELKAALKSLADSPLTQIQTDRSKIQGSALEAMRLIDKSP
ncbi:MAG: HEAT repeat domain-containing protein [Planctomycetaceae bacterium]|nr:HEAT repeat domain-containing protein [Planctomycetaceae bacterium]